MQPSPSRRSTMRYELLGEKEKKRIRTWGEEAYLLVCICFVVWRLLQCSRKAELKCTHTLSLSVSLEALATLASAASTATGRLLGLGPSFWRPLQHNLALPPSFATPWRGRLFNESFCSPWGFDHEFICDLFANISFLRTCQLYLFFLTSSRH